MNFTRTLMLGAALAASLGLGAPALAQADGYPQRVVTIVVPFPAGSATDIIARKVAEGMRAAFNQTFIVENKAGADGIIAAQAVINAPADGHTLFITTNTTHSANPNLYNKLPYDPQADFAPVGGILKISYLLAVRQDLPADDLKSFVALAKASKPPLSFGSGNTGSRAAAELLKARLGLEMNHVPYRGSPQALQDLMGGHIDVFFPDPAAAMKLLQDKKFKVIGSTGDKRIGSLPDLPTLGELGVKDYSIVAWVGMFASAKTPRPIIQRLQGELKTILDKPETIAFFKTLGADVFPAAGEELGAFVVEDTRRWKEIVEVAKMEKN